MYVSTSNSPDELLDEEGLVSPFSDSPNEDLQDVSCRNTCHTYIVFKLIVGAQCSTLVVAMGLPSTAITITNSSTILCIEIL